MKRVIISAVLLFIIISGSSVGCYIVYSRTNRIESEIIRLINIKKSGDKEKAEVLSSELEKNWEREKFILEILVSDEKLTVLDGEIAKLHPLISEDSDEAEAEAESVYRQLEYIRRTELPLWYNII
ncbi:MAG: DUF4363 family protein [Oscillospiraceae bacterium]|nr:DUF4363 family protein [Oscillospiraceae bacterium]